MTTASEQAMSLAEACRYLRVPRALLLEAIRRGQLPAHREGTDLVIHRDEVLALLDSPVTEEVHGPWVPQP